MYISYINIRARFYEEFSFKNVFLTNRRFCLKSILSKNSYVVSNRWILFKYLTELISNGFYLLLSKLMSSKRSLFKSNLNVRLLPRSLEICWIMTVSVMYIYLSVISVLTTRRTHQAFWNTTLYIAKSFVEL